jgi:hypothetical protein
MPSIVPLDYRVALDAIAPSVQLAGRPVVVCNLPALEDELRLRSLAGPVPTLSSVAVWIEPMQETWKSELEQLTARISNRGSLFVIYSRPLARLIPERQRWDDDAVGIRISGFSRLRRALIRAGFQIRNEYGFHGVQSISLNMAGKIAGFFRRDDLVDRLEFASRLRYCSSGLLAGVSTVALIEAVKSGNVGDRP